MLLREETWTRIQKPWVHVPYRPTPVEPSKAETHPHLPHFSHVNEWRWMCHIKRGNIGKQFEKNEMPKWPYYSKEQEFALSVRWK